MSDKTAAALSVLEKRLATMEAIVKNALPKETLKVMEKQWEEQAKRGEEVRSKAQALEKEMDANDAKDKENRAKQEAKQVKLEAELQQQKMKAIQAEAAQKSKDLTLEGRLKSLEVLVQHAVKLAEAALAKR